MQRRDGLLTLYIQHETPKGGKRAYWIPAPALQYWRNIDKEVGNRIAKGVKGS